MPISLRCDDDEGFCGGHEGRKKVLGVKDRPAKMVSGDGVGEGEGDRCPPATKEDITPNEVGSKNFCTSSRSSLRLDAVEPSEKRDIVLASDWSEALKSVNVGLQFSPSLDPGKPESLHGLGEREAACTA